MKKIASAALVLGLVAAPASYAFAQNYYQRQGYDTSNFAKPGSANRPMHGTHDKGAAVRIDNSNGMISGRQTWDGGGQ